MSGKIKIKIQTDVKDQTLKFAALELERYLNRMSNSGPVFSAVRTETESGKEEVEKGIHLRIMEKQHPLNEIVEDAESDDAYTVDIKKTRGTIIGTNPRSVLYGVYRFLEDHGCRWFRPGTEGEVIPSLNVGNLDTTLTEKAYYRYRGNNNCGSYAVENIVETIDWLPKVGLNMFFNEFFLPSHLYNRWYSHEYPSRLPPQPRSEREIEAYHEKTVREIKKRGLQYHTCGHDWTGKALGLSDAECGIDDPQYFNFLDEGKKQFLAQIKGKRKINAKGPRYTDLCYGNPRVRKVLIDSVVRYAIDHPEADYIHFWLSDLVNVSCECPLCRDTRPSDFYVMMLNGIDKELTRLESDARVCFLVYQDLYWAPLKESIKNPDRFVLMFAPSRRNYSEPYALDDENYSIPPFALNRNKRLEDNREYAAALRDWRSVFSGESFIFDYHMTYAHYLDQGYFQFTSVLAEDIRRLAALGFEGYVSCQVLRSYFPTGYPMYLHARLLWNPLSELDSVSDYYFYNAFGSEGRCCLEYMKALSEVFYNQKTYNCYTGVSGKIDLQTAQSFSAVDRLVEDFRPVAERSIVETSGSIRRSWEYVLIHMDLVLHMAKALRARFSGEKELCFRYWKLAVDYITAREEELQPVLDLFWFFRSLEDRYEVFEKTGNHEKWVYED